MIGCLWPGAEHLAVLSRAPDPLPGPPPMVSLITWGNGGSMKEWSESDWFKSWLAMARVNGATNGSLPASDEYED